MKKLLKENHRCLLIIELLLVVMVLSLSVFIFRSHLQSNNKANSSDPSLQTETEVMNTVDAVTREYIAQKYSNITDMQVTQEYVGGGYAIINATFTFESKKNQRKIYLQNYDSTWTVLHEDEKKISCTKVRELISIETILTSFCD
jgi:hypothetical protein